MSDTSEAEDYVVRLETMSSLYIFTFPHKVGCNSIADCKDCAKAEIDRLRNKVRVAKNRAERMHIILEDYPNYHDLISEVRHLMSELED